MEIKITEEQLAKAMDWLLNQAFLPNGRPTCEHGELKTGDDELAKILWDHLVKGDE